MLFLLPHNHTTDKQVNGWLYNANDAGNGNPGAAKVAMDTYMESKISLPLPPGVGWHSFAGLQVFMNKILTGTCPTYVHAHRMSVSHAIHYDT